MKTLCSYIVTGVYGQALVYTLNDLRLCGERNFPSLGTERRGFEPRRPRLRVHELLYSSHSNTEIDFRHIPGIVIQGSHSNTEIDFQHIPGSIELNVQDTSDEVYQTKVAINMSSSICFGCFGSALRVSIRAVPCSGKPTSQF